MPDRRWTSVRASKICQIARSSAAPMGMNRARPAFTNRSSGISLIEIGVVTAGYITGAMTAVKPFPNLRGFGIAL